MTNSRTLPVGRKNTIPPPRRKSLVYAIVFHVSLASHRIDAAQYNNLLDLGHLGVLMALTNVASINTLSAAAAEDLFNKRDSRKKKTSRITCVVAHSLLVFQSRKPIMVTFNGQRKLRKGTHSCWECKRRKARCAFSPSDDSVCVGCRRRGTKCLDQNESDIEPESRDARTNSRLDRIESMLETLLHQQESRKFMTSISEKPSAKDEGKEKLYVTLIYSSTCMASG